MRSLRNFFKMQERLERKRLRLLRKTLKKNKSFCCGIRYLKGRSMCWGLVFGVMLILWGVSQICEAIFHLSIPVFGVMLGIFLLYLGFNLITGGFNRKHYWYCGSGKHFNCHNSSCSTAMGTSSVKIGDENINNEGDPLEYRTVFGKSTLDLRAISVDKLKAIQSPLVVNIETVFGKTEVILSKALPVRIFVKGAFGNTSLPDSSSIVFGSHVYSSHGAENPLILMYISTVFGSTEVGID